MVVESCETVGCCDGVGVGFVEAGWEGAGLVEVAVDVVLQDLIMTVSSTS